MRCMCGERKPLSVGGNPRFTETAVKGMTRSTRALGGTPVCAHGQKQGREAEDR